MAVAACTKSGPGPASTSAGKSPSSKSGSQSPSASPSGSAHPLASATSTLDGQPIRIDILSLRRTAGDLALGPLPTANQGPLPHNTIQQLITSRSDCIYFRATRELSLLSRLPGNRAMTRWVTMVPGLLPPTNAGPGNDTGWSISADSGTQDHPCPPA